MERAGQPPVSAQQDKATSTYPADKRVLEKHGLAGAAHTFVPHHGHLGCAHAGASHTPVFQQAAPVAANASQFITQTYLPRAQAGWHADVHACRTSWQESDNRCRDRTQMNAPHKAPG